MLTTQTYPWPLPRGWNLFLATIDPDGPGGILFLVGCGDTFLIDDTSVFNLLPPLLLLDLRINVPRFEYSVLTFWIPVWGLREIITVIT